MATGSGQGTPAAPQRGMFTMASLRANLRQRLASTSSLPDATLNTFIQDAVRFYSSVFPRRWRHVLTMSAAQATYPLPANHGLSIVLSVEFPSGQSPRSFARQVEESAFVPGQGNFFVIRPVHDDVAPDEDIIAAYITFSTPLDGQAIIDYLAAHTVPVSDSDQITVPPQGWELLYAFVDFLGHWRFETDVASSPAPTTLVLAQLGQEARLAWYRVQEIVNLLREQNFVTTKGRPIWITQGSEA